MLHYRHTSGKDQEVERDGHVKYLGFYREPQAAAAELSASPTSQEPELFRDQDRDFYLVVMSIR